MSIILFIAVLIIGYLLGSVPFGLILTRYGGYGDIRAIGSGNIGATNVLRTGNKKLAFLTLLLDGGKGAAAYFIARALAPHLALDPVSAGLLAGGAALIGHLFPVWLKFKGGKGVATTLGLLLAAAPPIGLAACAIWLLMAFSFRYSSLSALTAILATPFIAHGLYADWRLTGLCGLCVLLVWVRHKANIQRLLRGEEPKIGKKKDAS